jgi:hypothetical protein
MVAPVLLAIHDQQTLYAKELVECRPRSVERPVTVAAHLVATSAKNCGTRIATRSFKVPFRTC